MKKKYKSLNEKYLKYESETSIEDVDYEYTESVDDRELKQPSQTIATIVPAPPTHKTDHKCK